MRLEAAMQRIGAGDRAAARPRRAGGGCAALRRDPRHARAPCPGRGSVRSRRSAAGAPHARARRPGPRAPRLLLVEPAVSAARASRAAVSACAPSASALALARSSAASASHGARTWSAASTPRPLSRSSARAQQQVLARPCRRPAAAQDAGQLLLGREHPAAAGARAVLAAASRTPPSTCPRPARRRCRTRAARAGPGRATLAGVGVGGARRGGRDRAVDVRERGGDLLGPVVAAAAAALEPVARRVLALEAGRPRSPSRARSATGSGSVAPGRQSARAAPAQREARSALQRREHHDAALLALGASARGSGRRRPEREREVELAEPEELPGGRRGAGATRPRALGSSAVRLRLTLIEYFDGFVRTIGFSMSVRRSTNRSHWLLDSIRRAARPSFALAPNSGRKPTWMWSAWSPITNVGPPMSISEMIWVGCIGPWSVSSLRIVSSVIEPRPWWPRIGVSLILAMSTALPGAWWETLPDAV